jgi:adenylyl-sulfate kinase
MTKRAGVFWFTGLSGAGKTTVAERLKPMLESLGYSVLVLDGDDIRARLHRHLGFTEPEILENNRLIAEHCREVRGDFDVILVPIISPYAVSRKHARDLLGEGFYEVYFDANLETVMARDVKGLYAKARRNELGNLIGYSPKMVYDRPQNSDFVVHSGSESVEESTRRFGNFVIKSLKLLQPGESP